MLVAGAVRRDSIAASCTSLTSASVLGYGLAASVSACVPVQRVVMRPVARPTSSRSSRRSPRRDASGTADSSASARTATVCFSSTSDGYARTLPTSTTSGSSGRSAGQVVRPVRSTSTAGALLGAVEPAVDVDGARASGPSRMRRRVRRRLPRLLHRRAHGGPDGVVDGLLGLGREPALQDEQVLALVHHSPAVADHPERHAQVRRQAVVVERVVGDVDVAQLAHRPAEHLAERRGGVAGADRVLPVGGVLGHPGVDAAGDVGRGDQLHAHRLGQRADGGGDQLLAQAGHHPAEAVGRQAREGRHRDMYSHAVRFCTRLELVGQREAQVALRPARRERRLVDRARLAHQQLARERQQVGVRRGARTSTTGRSAGWTRRRRGPARRRTRTACRRRPPGPVGGPVPPGPPPRPAGAGSRGRTRGGWSTRPAPARAGRTARGRARGRPWRTGRGAG